MTCLSISDVKAGVRRLFRLTHLIGTYCDDDVYLGVVRYEVVSFLFQYIVFTYKLLLFFPLYDIIGSDQNE